MDENSQDINKLIEVNTTHLEHFANDIKLLYFEGLTENNIQIIEYMLCNCEDIVTKLKHVIRELTENSK